MPRGGRPWVPFEQLEPRTLFSLGTISPDGDISVDPAWLPASGSAHYAMINGPERPPATNYSMRSSQLAHYDPGVATDIYSMTTLADVAQVDAVTLWTHGQGDGYWGGLGGSSTLSASVYLGGQWLDAQTLAIESADGGIPGWNSITFHALAGAPWTQADLDNLQVKLIDSNDPGLWAVQADYTIDDLFIDVSGVAGASNHLPEANNDAGTGFSVTHDHVLTISAASAGLLANDTDADGDDLTAIKVGNPVHGSVTVNSNGTFTYTPVAGYYGPDGFTYKANDGVADSAVATVSLVVTNSAPVVAPGQTFDVAEGAGSATRVGTVQASDEDGDARSFTILSGNTGGAFAIDPLTGELSVANATPLVHATNPTFTLTIRAADGVGTHSEATVAVNVRPSTQGPAFNEIVRPNGDHALSLRWQNSSGASSHFAAIAGESQAPAAPSGDGLSFAYNYGEPVSGQVDDDFAMGDLADVQSVEGVTLWAYGEAHLYGAAVALKVDLYMDGQWQGAQTLIALSNYGEAASPAWRSATFNAPGGVPWSAANLAAMRVRVSAAYDVGDYEFNANVSIQSLYARVSGHKVAPAAPANHAPTASDDDSTAYVVTHDHALVVAAPGAGVLANDADADGDALAAIKVGDPVHGSVTLNSDGTFLYTPTAGYVGPDSFSYKASDGQAESGLAVVSLNVTNAAPVAQEDAGLAAVVGQPILLGSLLANDVDPDGDALHVGGVTQPEHGTVSINANGTVVYTPAAGYFGPDSFTYRASDGLASSAPAVVSLVVYKNESALTLEAAPVVYGEQAEFSSTLTGAGLTLAGEVVTLTLSGPSGMEAEYQATTDAQGQAHWSISGLHVGQYSAAARYDGSASPEFEDAVGNAELEVAPAPVIVTPDDLSRLYGQANPAFTGTITGLQYDDQVDVRYFTSAAPGSGIGEYAIHAEVVGTSPGDYAFTLYDAVLSVAPAPLVLTAADASRRYGEANPTFAGVVADIVNSDVLVVTYVTEAQASSDVGSYAIVPSVAGAALSNYAVTLNSAALTVVPAPLTITAQNKSRMFGQENPVLTAEYVGLSGGDTPESLASPVMLSTAAESQSLTGAYLITAAGAQDPNYDITMVNGELTVTDVVLDVSITPDAAAPLQNVARTFSSAVVDPTNPAADGLVYLWRVTRAGQTLSMGSAANFTFTPAEAGSYEVELEVSSGFGRGHAAATISAGRNGPSFDLGSARTLTPSDGGRLTIDGTFQDGTGSSWVGSVDYGDGAGPQALSVDDATKSFGLDHLFSRAGEYTVTVSLARAGEPQSEERHVLPVVVALDNAPVAANAAYNIARDSARTLELGATDADQDDVTFILTLLPEHGLLRDGQHVVTQAEAAAGYELTGSTITYQPDTGYFGPDLFHFRASDGTQASAPASVMLEVSAQTGELSLVADQTRVTVDAGSEASNTGLLQFVGATPPTLTASIGAVSFNASTGLWSWHYTPTTDPALQSVVITATTAQNNSAAARFTLATRAVTPTVNLNGVGSVTAGTDYALSLTYSDPLQRAFDHWTIDWGDQAGPAQAVPASQSETTHRYLAAGDYDVTAIAVDLSGSSVAAKSLSVHVLPVTPRVEITGAPAGGVTDWGQPLSLAATVLGGVGPAGSFQYAWSASLDGQPLAGLLSTGPSLLFQPPAPGVYQVTLAVTDAEGHIGSGVARVQVNRVAPVISITGLPNSAIEGQAVAVDAAVTDSAHEAAAGMTYSWSVARDGLLLPMAQGASEHFSFVPRSSGLFHLTLKVTDAQGVHSTVVRDLTVNNVAPVAAILDAPANLVAGVAVTIHSLATDAGADEILSYRWVVRRGGDIVATGSDADLSFTPGDGGAYDVALTVTDEDHAAGQASATIQVANAPVSVSIDAAGDEIAAGATMRLVARATSPAAEVAAAGFEYLWSVTRDGEPVAITHADAAAFAFTPTQAGLYHVAVHATDRNAVAADSAVDVTVVATPPVIAIDGIGGTIREGDVVTLQAHSTGVTPIASYHWSIARGEVDWPIANSGNSTIQFAPDDGGSYTLTLEVVNLDGLTATCTETIRVADVAPTIAPLGDVALAEAAGGLLSRTGAFSTPLPNTNEHWTGTVDYGDGSGAYTVPIDAAARTFALEHVYARTGLYHVKLTLADDDGQSSAATFAVSADLGTAPVVASSSIQVEGESQGVTLAATHFLGEVSFEITRLPEHGSLVDGDHTITASEAAAGYTLSGAEVLFVREASQASQGAFIYRARSNGLTSEEATVFVDVLAMEHRPRMVGQNLATAPGQDLEIHPLAGSTADRLDPNSTTLELSTIEGTSVSAGSVVATLHGSLLLHPDGSLTYTPVQGYQGDDGFSFTAVNGSGNSELAVIHIHVAPPTSVELPPGTQPALAANSAGPHEVQLSWTAQPTPILGVRVERSIAGGDFVPLVTLDSGALVYVDQGLDEGTSYEYRVIPFNAAGDGPAATDQAVTPLSAPTGLVATVVSNSSVSLSWTNVSAAASGVQVEQSTDGAIFSPLASLSAQANTYVVAGLKAASTYWFRVRAAGANVNSEYTPGVSASTPAEWAVSVSGSANAAEGESYQLFLHANGGGVATGWSIDWGDGDTSTAAGDATSVSHVFLDGGRSVQIVAVAQAADGPHAADPLNVSIAAGVPTVSVQASASTVEVGQAVLLALSVQVPGHSAVRSQTVNWGDGVSERIQGDAVSASHTYLSRGVFSVIVSATNAGGTSYSSPAIVRVQPQGAIDIPLTDLSPAADLGNNTTARPVIVGTVAGVPDHVRAVVQVRTSNSGAANLVVLADERTGRFVADLSASLFTPGTVTIYVRAGLPGMTGAYEYGQWQPYTFTYTPASATPAPSETSTPSAADWTVSFAAGSWGPEVELMSAARASHFIGEFSVVGLFPDYANRFNPGQGQSYNISEGSSAPPQVSSGAGAGGLFTTTTFGLSTHHKESIVNADGSWSFEDALDSSYDITTILTGTDGSHSTTEQSGSRSYLFQAWGDSAGATYKLLETSSDDFLYDWGFAGLTPQSQTTQAVHRGGSQSYSLSAGGQVTISTGGDQASTEYRDYKAFGGNKWSDATWNHQGPVVGPAVQADSSKSQENDWTYSSKATFTSGPQGKSSTDSYQYTLDCTEGYSEGRKDSSVATLGASGVTSSTTHGNNSGLTGDTKTKFSIAGDTSRSLDGHWSALTTYSFDQLTKDTFKAHDHETTNIVDNSAAGLAVQSQTVLDLDLFRERTRHQTNNGTTSAIDGKFAFVGTTFGENTTSAKWKTQQAVNVSGTDAATPGTTRSFTSKYLDSQSGKSDYSQTSAGPVTQSASGAVTEGGSTTTTSSTEGDTSWDHSDSGQVDSASTTGPANNSTFILTHGTSSSSDIGSSSYSAHATGTATSGAGGTITKTGKSDSSASASGSTADMSSFTSHVVIDDSHASGVVRQIVSNATQNTDNSSGYVSKAHESASYAAAGSSSTAGQYRHEAGTTSSANTSSDSTSILDGHLAGMFINSFAQDSSAHTSSGDFTLDYSLSSASANGTLVFQSESSVRADKGITSDSQSTSTQAHYCDATVNAVLTMTDTTSASGYHATGEYNSSSKGGTNSAGGATTSTYSDFYHDNGHYNNSSSDSTTIDQVDKSVSGLTRKYQSHDRYLSSGTGTYSDNSFDAGGSGTAGEWSSYNTYGSSSGSGPTEWASGYKAESKGSYTAGKGVTRTVDSVDAYEQSGSGKYNANSSYQTNGATIDSKSTDIYTNKSHYDQKGQSTWTQGTSSKESTNTYEYTTPSDLQTKYSNKYEEVHVFVQDHGHSDHWESKDKVDGGNADGTWFSSDKGETHDLDDSTVDHENHEYVTYTSQDTTFAAAPAANAKNPPAIARSESRHSVNDSSTTVNGDVTGGTTITWDRWHKASGVDGNSGTSVVDSIAKYFNHSSETTSATSLLETTKQVARQIELGGKSPVSIQTRVKTQASSGSSSQQNNDSTTTIVSNEDSATQDGSTSSHSKQTETEVGTTYVDSTLNTGGSETQVALDTAGAEDKQAFHLTQQGGTHSKDHGDDKFTEKIVTIASVSSEGTSRSTDRVRDDDGHFDDSVDSSSSLHSAFNIQGVSAYSGNSSNETSSNKGHYVDHETQLNKTSTGVADYVVNGNTHTEIGNDLFTSGYTSYQGSSKTETTKENPSGNPGQVTKSAYSTSNNNSSTSDSYDTSSGSNYKLDAGVTSSDSYYKNFIITVHAWDNSSSDHCGFSIDVGPVNPTAYDIAYHSQQTTDVSTTNVGRSTDTDNIDNKAINGLALPRSDSTTMSIQDYHTITNTHETMTENWVTNEHRTGHSDADTSKDVAGTTVSGGTGSITSDALGQVSSKSGRTDHDSGKETWDNASSYLYNYHYSLNEKGPLYTVDRFENGHNNSNGTDWWDNTPRTVITHAPGNVSSEIDTGPFTGRGESHWSTLSHTDSTSTTAPTALVPYPPVGHEVNTDSDSGHSNYRFSQDWTTQISNGGSPAVSGSSNAEVHVSGSSAFFHDKGSTISEPINFGTQVSSASEFHRLTGNESYSTEGKMTLSSQGGKDTYGGKIHSLGKRHEVTNDGKKATVSTTVIQDQAGTQGFHYFKIDTKFTETGTILTKDTDTDDTANVQVDGSSVTSRDRKVTSGQTAHLEKGETHDESMTLNDGSFVSHSHRLVGHDTQWSVNNLWFMSGLAKPTRHQVDTDYNSLNTWVHDATYQPVSADSHSYSYSQTTTTVDESSSSIDTGFFVGVVMHSDIHWVTDSYAVNSGVNLDKSNFYQGQYDGWDKVDTVNGNESSHFDEHKVVDFINPIEGYVVLVDNILHTDNYSLNSVSRYYQSPNSTTGPATGTLMMTDQSVVASSHGATSAVDSGGLHLITAGGGETFKATHQGGPLEAVYETSRRLVGGVVLEHTVGHGWGFPASSNRTLGNAPSVAQVASAINSGWWTYIGPIDLSGVDFGRLLQYLDPIQMAIWAADYVIRKAPIAQANVIDFVATKGLQDVAAGWWDGLASTINPLDSILPLPKFGHAPYGHDVAYNVGQVTGTVTGVAAGILIGNAAAGANGLIACGSMLQKAAKLYTMAHEVAGLATAGVNLANGNAGVGDLLAFAPALSYGASKAGQAMGLLSKNCFVAGTMVVVRVENGQLIEKPIEEIREGETVLARSELDPEAPLEERRVVQLFRHTAYVLRDIEIDTGEGQAETLKVTAEHLVYVENKGWIEAQSLSAGDVLLSPDGTRQAVRGNQAELHPEGVVVYNFEVEGDHTYFVDADALQGGGVVWVHNTCVDARILRQNLIASGEKVPQAKNWAAHIVPTGEFRNRNAEVRKAIRESQAIIKKAFGKNGLNDARNGFFSVTSNHGGTHTNKFLLEPVRYFNPCRRAEPTKRRWQGSPTPAT